MKIIDLTRTIDAGMPVFPGTEPPRLEQTNTLEKDGFRETLLSLYSHTGTHVDAPSHLLSGGQTLSEFPLESFFGRAELFDLTGLEGRGLGLKDLKPFEERIGRTDFLLLHTGWGRHWGSSEYFDDFPVLDGEAASWLARFSLKGIGIDAISFDSMDSTEFPVHRTLLSREILLIENLANLENLKKAVPTIPDDGGMYVSVFPLKVEGCDGSPVRAAVILQS